MCISFKVADPANPRIENQLSGPDDAWQEHPEIKV
jgi:hypothetical protein